MAAIDEGIGRVLSTLDQYGLDGGKTLIAFLSDNGPDDQHGWEAHWPSHIMMGDPGPFSGSKNQFWEGGSRIPFILRWPGEIAAGSIYRQQVMSFDLLPTFIAAAHGRMPAGTNSDGVDLLPYVREYSGGSPHDILFWKGEKQGAARMGDWKPEVPSRLPARLAPALQPETRHQGVARRVARERRLLLGAHEPLEGVVHDAAQVS